METLTKQHLIDEVSLRLGLSKREAKRVVELFFFHLNDTLIGGEDVKLSGFGNFTLHDKVARPGRNPKTKETVLISARRVVTFRAGNKLRDIIAQTLMDMPSSRSRMAN